MKKSICALFVALSILLMMGCAASTKEAADIEIVALMERKDNGQPQAVIFEAVDKSTEEQTL